MLVLLVFLLRSLQGSECKQEETKINYMMICKERMGGLTSGEGGGEMERGDKDLWGEKSKNR